MPRQAMPTKGKQDVPPITEAFFRGFLFATPDSVGKSLMKRLTERNEEGLKTYGTYLQTHNGRNALLDALDECLDAVQYVTQAILELEDEGFLEGDRVIELQQIRSNTAMSCLLLVAMLEEDKREEDGQ